MRGREREETRENTPTIISSLKGSVALKTCKKQLGPQKCKGNGTFPEGNISSK
jgi:hypothetical protein